MDATPHAPSASAGPSVTALIGIGANIGDRLGTIRKAVDLLRAHGRVRDLILADVIETAPVGNTEQPEFLNTAARLETTLGAAELLDLLLAVEASLGRDRSTGERWGPRTIDLDLLMYGDAIIELPGLTVPHPRLHERLFVLDPCVQIAPELVHPVLGQPLEAVRSRLVQGAPG